MLFFSLFPLHFYLIPENYGFFEGIARISLKTGILVLEAL